MAIHGWHGQIHHDNFRGMFFRERDGLMTIFSLGNDIEVRLCLQQSLKSLADNDVVVHQKYGNLFHAKKCDGNPGNDVWGDYLPCTTSTDRHMPLPRGTDGSFRKLALLLQQSKELMTRAGNGPSEGQKAVVVRAGGLRNVRPDRHRRKVGGGLELIARDVRPGDNDIGSGGLNGEEDLRARNQLGDLGRPNIRI